MKSEQGAVSVLAIMVLLLLTIAGIASLYTARTEIQIAGNERDYVSALSASDAALNEAAQRLTHSSRAGALLDENKGWIIRRSQNKREEEMENFIKNILLSAPPKYSGNTNAPPNTTEITVPGHTDTYYSAIHWGNARGSSLDITQTKPLLGYSIYGFHNEDMGSLDPDDPNSSKRSVNRSLVESGYRNR